MTEAAHEDGRHNERKECRPYRGLLDFTRNAFKGAFRPWLHGFAPPGADKTGATNFAAR
jgi:hypothetical protein